LNLKLESKKKKEEEKKRKLLFDIDFGLKNLEYLVIRLRRKQDEKEVVDQLGNKFEGNLLGSHKKYQIHLYN